ncbi:MAG: nascent polypeptide-associated complex protein [Ignisphaera sp.]|nr:nascent polypeptide-associated complex protein [Ignisphaera sp.]MCX8167464.1 nascent polypeptide-associated complex protein [Ignisphaera sp.]MDW8084672.1 nascent polypeptide-associated complex protein [Ignisphaera sp.]
MFPINPRELQKQLKQLKKMGMKIEQLENVDEVVIKLGGKRLVLERPDVMSFEFASQKIFYIVPKSVKEESEDVNTAKQSLSVKDEDVSFIAEFVGVSYDAAKEALIRAGGDIAKAIEMLQSEKKQ